VVRLNEAEVLLGVNAKKYQGGHHDFCERVIEGDGLLFDEWK
jgi:hypothetical protein